MIFAGIDVAKDNHDYFITNSDGKVFYKVFTITNNLEGFHDLYIKSHLLWKMHQKQK